MHRLRVQRAGHILPEVISLTGAVVADLIAI
jgi:hypothetical protein